MSYWYYYDNNGQKQGPYSGGQLRQLARLGTIMPETQILTAEGATVPAKEVNGLSFAETAPETPASSLPSIEANPFVDPMPVEANPFTDTMPLVAVPAAKWSLAPVKKAFVRFFGFLIVLLLLVAVVGTAWPILSESGKLDAVAKNLIEEDLAGKPIDIIDISIDWTNKPTTFDVMKSFWRSRLGYENEVAATASGKITVKAGISEKLYESIGHKTGLLELHITDTHEDKFNTAVEFIRNLPEEYRRHLRVPGLEDLSQFRFCKVHLPEGEELTLAGRIELIRNDNRDWHGDGIRIDPVSETDFTPGSRLSRDLRKLDDPETKKAVNAIIEARKEFVERANQAYGDWNFKEVSMEALRKTVLDRSLKSTDISVDWKNRGTDSASGTFTVKAGTTEKLYQTIDRKVALEKLDSVKQHEKVVEELGVAEIFKEEILDGNLLKHFDFYELVHPSGSEVSLTGSIKMSKSEHGPWSVDGIRVDSVNPALDGFIPDSRLEDVHKLDDPATKKNLDAAVRDFVDWLATLIKQKDDFDNFCKGKRYKGNLKSQGARGPLSFDVYVVFEEPTDPNTNKAEGAIEVRSHGWKGNRPFTVTFDMEGEPKYPVTGTIDNAPLPGWQKFRDNTKDKIVSRDDEESANRFYNLLRDNIKIDINFMNNELDFSITDRNGANRRPLNLIETRVTDNAPSNEAHPKPDRRWIIAAIKKRPQTMRPQSKPPAAPLGGGRPAPQLTTSALELNEAIRQSGFDAYRGFTNFVEYGSKSLRDKLHEEQRYLGNVDEFDKAEAQKRVNAAWAKIRREQKEIAKRTFYSEYTYSTSNVKVNDDKSSCTISISTEFRSPQARGGIVSFPVPNVDCNLVDESRWGSISFSVSGNTASIQELVRNNHLYRVRTQFKNLRSESNGPHADLEKIDIYRIGDGPKTEEPEEPDVDWNR